MHISHGFLHPEPSSIKAIQAMNIDLSTTKTFQSRLPTQLAEVQNVDISALPGSLTAFSLKISFRNAILLVRRKCHGVTGAVTAPHERRQIHRRREQKRIEPSSPTNTLKTKPSPASQPASADNATQTPRAAQTHTRTHGEIERGIYREK